MRFLYSMIKKLTYKTFVVCGILLLASTMTSYCQTNEGTDFWMAFMEHLDINNNSMVVMITSKYNTTGTVSMPGKGFTTNFSVAENDVTFVRMPANAETIGSERIDNNAIRVQSAKPVSVYIHQYQDYHAEASIVLPLSSISNKYYVISHEGTIRRSSNNEGASEFVVVGVEDQTAIRIELSDKTRGGKDNNDIIDITLDQGETYQVRGLNTNTDLTGTFISGDKIFSVFAGSSYSKVPKSCLPGNGDNLLEQMYPINTLGNEYVTAPTRQGYDVFRILAVEDNSEMIIISNTGVEEVINLNAGEFYEYERSNPTIVRNRNPNDKRGFMLTQYLIGSECINEPFGGPSMVILSSIEQIRDTVTVFNSALEDIRENYLSIICQTKDVDGIEINDRAVNATWQSIGTDQKYSYAIESVNATNHTITSSGCGVIAMAYGFGTFEGYAYFGGASFNIINGNQLPDGECVGNPVQFSSGLPPDRYDVLWTTELLDTVRVHDFQLDFPNNDEGEYQVRLETFDNCFLVADTLEKKIKMTYQEITVAQDESITICEDEFLELKVGDLANATYEWQGPNDFTSEDQNTSLDVDPSYTGDFEITATIFGCIAQPDFVKVLINPLPIPNLGADSVYCDRSGIPHTLNPGRYDMYNWSDGSSSTTLDILDDGDYSVTITDANGCAESDDIFFGPQCPSAIYIPSAFTPNGDDINDSFELNAFDIIAMEIQIFDRWGNLVYQNSNDELKWDGTFNNQPASSGVYVWTLQYSGYDSEGEVISEHKKGQVQLIR